MMRAPLDSLHAEVQFLDQAAPSHVLVGDEARELGGGIGHDLEPHPGVLVPDPGHLQRLEHFVVQALDHGLGSTKSEEHTSELQSLMRISYAVFCLKKKQKHKNTKYKH